MSAAEAVAVVMFVAITAYAVFGGADFGSGVWDLTAGGPHKGAPTRRLIDHAIGPVWEANHVWLIFVLVFLWTGFPQPFATLMNDLAIPFWLAGLGITARGAGFAFRKFSPTMRGARTAGVIFASASLLTPFFLGAIAGAVASGRVVTDGSHGLWRSWLGPTSILGGLLAVATCTLLAGIFLAAEAAKIGDVDLAESLRDKSLVGATITGLIALLGIPVLLADSETLSAGLLGRALPIVAISAFAGLWTIRALWTRKLRLARVTSVIAVAAIVIGWGVAQHPWILVDQVKISEGAGASSSLIGLLIAGALAGVLVLPPLIYLFSLAEDSHPH